MDHAAADACSDGLQYVAAWAAQLERQATLPVDVAAAEALLASVGSLAASVQTCLIAAAETHQESAAEAPLRPLDSLAQALASCCELASLALQRMAHPPPEPALRSLMAG